MDAKHADTTTEAAMIPTACQSRCESHEALDFAPSYMTTTTSSTHNNDGKVLSLPKATIEDQTQGDIQSQDSSPLFRLSPELRNIIYKYAFDGRGDECGWDEEHNCPKINLLDAIRNAPSNDLTGACRRIRAESMALFVEAQRAFWSGTTFTLTFVREKPSGANVDLTDCLEHLSNSQISSITRIIISIVVEGGESLAMTLTPKIGSGTGSWYANRTENYNRRYTDRLDSLYHLLPVEQLCHAHCQPLLTYYDARARARYVRWHGPSSNFVVKRRRDCAACGSDIGILTLGDGRSDLMIVAASICDMFDVTL